MATENNVKYLHFLYNNMTVPHLWLEKVTRSLRNYLVIFLRVLKCFATVEQQRCASHKPFCTKYPENFGHTLNVLQAYQAFLS